MPRSSDPGQYPQAYCDYLREVALNGKTMRVPRVGALPDDEDLTGQQRALKLRGHFYAFIGALKREAKANPDGPWAELANYAKRTMVYYNKGECALYFVPREQSWQQKLLDDLGGPAGEAQPSAKASERSLVVLKNLLTAAEAENDKD